MPGSELIGDSPSIGQRSCEAVELGHHQGVASSTSSQSFAKSGAVTVSAGQAVIDVDPFGLHTKTEEGLPLNGQVLLIS